MAAPNRKNINLNPQSSHSKDKTKSVPTKNSIRTDMDIGAILSQQCHWHDRHAIEQKYLKTRLYLVLDKKKVAVWLKVKEVCYENCNQSI